MRTKKQYKSSFITSLHSTLRPHNTPPKELTDSPEPVLRPLKLALEQVMLISRFYLPLTNSLDGGILWRANGAFSVFVDLVQTALVEGVFAEEVDCREIEASTAGHASACLENNGFSS